VIHIHIIIIIYLCTQYLRRIPYLFFFVTTRRAYYGYALQPRLHRARYSWPSHIEMNVGDTHYYAVLNDMTRTRTSRTTIIFFRRTSSIAQLTRRLGVTRRGVEFRVQIILTVPETKFYRTDYRRWRLK